MFCPFCGASIEDGATFCTSCGQKLGETAVPPQPQSPPQPAAMQPYGISEDNPYGNAGGGAYGPVGGGANTNAGGDSYFDGTGVDLFIRQLILGLVTMFTCGIATPFALVNVIQWETSHIVINGKRQSFNGTAIELFGMWIKWFLLSLITCGLYSYYANVDYQKWVARHTTYAGKELPEGNIYPNSYFDGTFAEYIGTALITTVLSSVTCGLAYPWGAIMVQNWKIKGLCIDSDRYTFDGDGAGLFGVFIINWLLTLVTCGIYSAWARCAVNRYMVSHTHIDPYRRG